MANISEADRAQLRRALPEIDLIADEALRAQVADTLIVLWKESGWDDLYAVPYLTELPEVSWVQHTRFVAAGTARMVDLYKEITGRALDRDLAVAAALLHDGSKFQEYARAEAGYVKSELGLKLQHSFCVAHVALERGLPLDLVHLIASHTPMCFVPPRLPEGWIVREVDALMLEALLNTSQHNYVSGYYGKPQT